MTLSPGSVTRRSPLPPLSELVSRVDLYALVERYAGPGRASGHTVTYSCPNPAHPDYSPSFTVAPDKAGKLWAKCWSACDWHGDALALVKWLEGVDTAEAARRLRAFIGDPETLTATPAPKPRRQTPRKPIANLRDISPRPDKERAQAFLGSYLKWRGWPASVVETFGLEVVNDARDGVLRVRHPYLAPSHSGEWGAVWWQDRGPATHEPRWKAPYGSERVLYNLRSLERDDLAGVVLTEGPADAITATLALKGVEGVAVLGVPGVGAWRAEWAELLDGLRVVVAIDNDANGTGLKLARAVQASLQRPLWVVKPSLGDLTETYREDGGSVRSLLLGALEIETKEPRLSELFDELELEALYDAFPEGHLVTEEAGHE